MKKLFFLAATLCGAMAINAASFTGFDGRKGDLGTQIHDNNLIQNQVNCNLNETDKDAHKYSIQNVTGGEATTFTMGGISFYASDATAPKDLWKTYGTYIQPNGARRTITIPTVAGQQVDIYVQDAVNGLKVEGLAATSLDLVASGADKDIVNTVTATGTSIVLYSNDASDTAIKPKYQAIIPHTGTGLMDAAAAPAQAKKMIINGHLYIRNANGELVNVLGL